MIFTGKLKVIDDTRSGISKATGNPWVSKECVIEVDEEGKEHPHTLACYTADAEIAKNLEVCEPGDLVKLDISFFSEARSYRSKEGQEIIDRKTKAYIKRFLNPV